MRKVVSETTMYDVAEELFGLEYQTLVDIKNVANKVKVSFRNLNLTFAHNRAVAPYADFPYGGHVQKMLSEQAKSETNFQIFDPNNHGMCQSEKLLTCTILASRFTKMVFIL